MDKYDHIELKDALKGENLHEQSQKIKDKWGTYFQLISRTIHIHNCICLLHVTIPL